MTVTTAAVADALVSVIDPELGVDVVSLGLVYRIDADDSAIRVEMTTTTRSCPMGAAMQEAAGRVMAHRFPGVPAVIEHVTEPPWEVEFCSQQARDWLGIPARGSR